MALTVVIALVAAFVLSLTFVPAMIAMFVTGRVREGESYIVRGARRFYEPLLTAALRETGMVIWGGIVLFAPSLLLFTRLGQEFTPTIDEKDIALPAVRIPGTSLTQSTEMQLRLERGLQTIPEVALVFSKTGTAEMATDPMPPNLSDTFVILKPQQDWPDP